MGPNNETDKEKRLGPKVRLGYHLKMYWLEDEYNGLGVRPDWRKDTLLFGR